uniref:Leucine rich repeat containing 74A n=1 Tax=Accipiter nisus TaxID=211598 RepID=A0A8B9N103_9AVES
MEVVPVSHFIQNLAKPYINLNHHGLGPKGVKAIAIALVSNTTVTHLELEDNCILAEGAICITEMLRENSSLQELNMSNNHLDTAGAEAFASLLLDNMSYLHTLQLSGGSHCLCTFVSLQGNYQVKELDLSHNEFSEKGGQLLGQMLGNLIYYSHVRMVSVTLATMTNVSEHKHRMRNHSNSSPCQREGS